MRSLPVLAALAVLSLPACGSNDGSATSGSNTTGTPGGYNPGEVPQGYTRLVSQTIHDIKPGDDVTFCQYVMAPTDHDVDVLDVVGSQSAFGHHAVAFSYTATGKEQIGTSIPCMGTEFTSGDGTTTGSDPSLSLGAFLGAVGGAGNESATKLPEGVAFRLQKGQGVMLNVHYLNTGTVTIDGDAVVDMKFAEVDPTRKIAAMFINFNGGFDLPANTPTDSSIECTAGSDVSILMMTNHMHEFGTHVATQITRAAGGAVEMVHEDPTWTYDMQFNPVYTKWDVANPFVIHAGDTIKTTCSWNNTTSNEMKFPREMCLGVGFALTTGDNPHVPSCFGGQWLSGLL